ncbi:hypothetical protein [Saccharomonospora piscinae]|uniref:hypothetical protein n=1 Tax=Saccharomonospora piscinae TaxID=687388 RepID=UPI0012DC27D1|nr:hypothetical protein [Saccharomonospora piscinae]
MATPHASDRLRYVTANFELLQGLAVLPAVSWVALAMTWSADWLPGGWVLAAAAPAALATVAALRHYRNRYGQVRARRRDGGDLAAVAPVAALLVVAAITGRVGESLPVSLPVIVLGAAAVAAHRWHRPLAPALTLVGAAGLVVGLVPLAGPGAPHSLTGTEHWILAYCTGAAAVLAWGHVVLRRTLTVAGAAER